MRFHLNVFTTARYLWAAATGAVIVGSLSPGNSSLMRAVASIHIQDKVLHFAAYLCLATFPILGMRRRIEAVLGAGSMMLLGLLLEIMQYLVPGRSPEVADEVANVLGVLCGMALAFPFRGWQRGVSHSRRLLD